MQYSRLIVMPVDELREVITNCITSCLKSPSIHTTEEALLTEAEAAQLLNISSENLHSLISKCEIPVRLQRKKGSYFSKRDLIAWSEAHLQNSQA